RPTETRRQSMSQPRGGEEQAAFEDRLVVQEAIEDDTTVPGLEAPDRREPDADTASFQEPGQPPRTYWP
ncbi:MAG TPA: hypothetical protein VGP02_15975, partial [Mycobacteriales bacterium]|nr:hypothetical protein [Mycobacteriales bacterium]